MGKPDNHNAKIRVKIEGLALAKRFASLRFLACFGYYLREKLQLKTA